MVHHFHERDGELWCEDVPMRTIAEEVGTPAYVYSRATFTRHFKVFDGAFGSLDHLVCYSVKACSNLSILRLLSSLGSGFDIVSGGELHRVLLAGVSAERVIFGGVGKRADEIEAALRAGILLFNVESEGELRLISQVATRLGTEAPIALRVNPDVDAKTHPYISTGLRSNKFGVPLADARRLYGLAAELPGLRVAGLDCHIGSQLTELGPISEALDHILALASELESDGHDLQLLDIGGGLGIPYQDEAPPHPDAYGKMVADKLAGRSYRLLLEPGRVIAGNAGVLLMSVLYTKSNGEKSFVVVDAAMNDSVRPALYGAHHTLRPVSNPSGPATTTVDVVGPICESGDFFARDRELAAIADGELLAMHSAGAYGFSMSSNYNSRPRAAEVLVDGNTYRIIRQRESLDDLTARELACL